MTDVILHSFEENSIRLTDEGTHKFQITSEQKFLCHHAAMLI